MEKYKSYSLFCRFVWHVFMEEIKLEIRKENETDIEMKLNTLVL